MTCRRSRRRIILSGFVFWGIAARFLELSQYGNLAHIILGSMQQEPSAIKQESSPLKSTRRIDTSAKEKDSLISKNHKDKNHDDDRNSSSNRRQKPSLIIHVGVHKTGTTTIQTDAAEHFTEALAKDNYVYLGKASEIRGARDINNTIQNTIRWAGCVRRVQEANNSMNNSHVQNSTKIPACWNTLLQELDHYKQLNTSIILSDEDFSHDSLFTRGVYSIPGYFDMLSQTLLVDWNVTIVIGYRRYAEWAMSSLKQLQAGTCFRKQSGWKHEGGEACAEPWEYIPQWMHRQPWPSARVYRSYEEQVDMWQSHGFDTKILNFHHSNQHLSTTLFCNVLTDTPHTCDCARNRPLQTKENALGVAEAAYSNIVFAAAQRGFFNNTTSPDDTRSRLTRQLLHHHKQQQQQQQQHVGSMSYSSIRHLPLICPPQSELEELLNISLAVEQRFMPELYNSPGNRDEHTRSFWSMANERKELCKIDTETLLEGVSSWASLLAKLSTYPIDK